MAELSTPLLIGIFIASAGLIWWAGQTLAVATDAMDVRFGWGEGLGGAVFLAIATNLPEVAVVVASSYNGSLQLAAGNILGGIAIQTVVLVILDRSMPRASPSLSYVVSSLTVVLEGLLLVAILMLCIIGALSPRELVFFRTTPAELLILAAWIAGLWLVRKSSNRAAWRVTAEKTPGESNVVVPNRRPFRTVVRSFALAALVTLGAGVALALTSETLADRAHIGGAVFGGTFLAGVTALPELTTGLAAVRAGRYELALSDIIGGNAFLPVLFLLGTLLSGQALLPDARSTDLYLTALGALLTSVYCAGVILRSKRRWLGMGFDSSIVLALYLCGIAGLFVIVH